MMALALGRQSLVVRRGGKSTALLAPRPAPLLLAPISKVRGGGNVGVLWINLPRLWSLC